MKIDWIAVLRQLVLNAVFWVGAFAIAMTLFSPGESVPFLEIFLFFLGFNLLALGLLRAFAPKILEQMPRDAQSGEKRLGFRLYPVSYPKVWVDELKDYAPEFIHVDISDGGNLLFGANVTRDALQQFRDSLNGALGAKDAGRPGAEKRAKPRQNRRSW